MTADTLNGQLGMGEETVYGTGVTPTRWVEFLTFGLKKEKTRIISKGIRPASGIVPAKGAPAGSTKVQGPIELEGQTKGMGLLLKHIFGTVATSQPAVGPSPTVYDHTFTPGGVAGKMLTMEAAFLDDAAGAHSMTAKGCKVSTAEFSVKSNELQTIKLDVNAQNIVTSDAKTTASYASAIRQYGSASVSLSLGGSAIVAEEATITFNNQLDSKDYLGNAGLQSAPVTLERLGIEASLVAPWGSWTDYARLDSDTDAALVVTCEGPIIEDAYTFMLRFTMNVRTDGETPELSSRSRINQPLKFACVGDTAAEAITCLYRSSDATP